MPRALAAAAKASWSDALGLVTVSSHFALPPEKVWEQVRRPALLLYVAQPILAFTSRDGGWPAQWDHRVYHAGLRAFGVLPVGEQVIGIEYQPEQPSGYKMRDKGRGGLISRWDHMMVIEPEGDGTRYTDRVEIEAGVLTPVACAFARFFYTHRQKRWQQLIAQDFAQLG